MEPSASADEVGALLKQAGVEDLIDLAPSSDDADQSKPDPDIIRAALKRGNVSPEQAIMLGDTPYDIEAAERSGVSTIALRCGGWWNDVALSRAVALYDDPEDLVEAFDRSPLACRRL